MIKELQQKADQLEDLIISRSRSGTRDDIFVLLTHLLAECGEAADEIKGLEGKRVEPAADYSKDELAKELVDIMFNILRLARHYGIDLDDHFDSRLDAIRDKFAPTPD